MYMSIVLKLLCLNKIVWLFSYFFSFFHFLNIGNNNNNNNYNRFIIVFPVYIDPFVGLLFSLFSEKTKQFKTEMQHFFCPSLAETKRINVRKFHYYFIFIIFYFISFFFLSNEFCIVEFRLTLRNIFYFYCGRFTESKRKVAIHCLFFCVKFCVFVLFFACV